MFDLLKSVLVFFARSLSFVFGFFFYTMERCSDWLIGVPSKTEYVRIGKCKRCGKCCRLLALEMPAFFESYSGSVEKVIPAKAGIHVNPLDPRLRGDDMPKLLFFQHFHNAVVRFLILFHRVCFNFEFKNIEKNWLIYRCNYLDDSSATKCGIYQFRHRLCRNYPNCRLYGHPKTHPDCGFRFVRRDGKPTFDEILDEKRSKLLES